MNPTDFREIVSGRRQGIGPALLRAALRIVETPYTAVVRHRNRGFDSGKRPITRVERPVISVGNLTLGGTGKTPLVAWLARWLRERGVRVSIISRGYGAKDGSRNDEALELEQSLPDVPHLQNPDRVSAAQTAIEELDTQLIVLDDAFQHRRIARDLDIVLLDALEPFGFDHVFPRGVLREPVAGLQRADVVALTRADMLSDKQRAAIRDRAMGLAPQAVWLELVHAPRALVNAAGEEQPLELLRDAPTAAFCGIGNPGGFRHTLHACGLTPLMFREYADHHDYSRADIESLIAWTADSTCEAVLCTQKDLVKIGVERLGVKPLWAIAIGIEFLAGQTEFEQLLEPLVRRAVACGEGE